MTQAAHVHPLLVHPALLGATLERLNQHADYLHITVGTPSGEGWLDAAALAARTSFQRDEMMARIAATNHTEDRHVVAMWFWNAYTWPVLMGSVLSYLFERRVPDLAPANIVLHWNDAGMTDRMAFRSEHFWALPKDPAAEQGECTIVANEDALRAVLIEQITQHYIPPMLAVLTAQSPLGTRALWATVADRCVGTVLQAARELGNDACRHEIAALVQNAPLRGSTDVLAIDHAGRETLFLQRGGCCYSYKLPKYGYCATCPLLSVEERVQRLRTQLAQIPEGKG